MWGLTQYMQIPEFYCIHKFPTRNNLQQNIIKEYLYEISQAS